MVEVANAKRTGPIRYVRLRLRLLALVLLLAAASRLVWTLFIT
jgi:hypothetical protein